MEHLMNFVEVNGKHYYVSTNDTFDHGLETMVFPCNENNEVVSWSDLYCEWYTTYDNAIRGHEYVCENLDKLLKEE